jgi:hypothetical protein
MSQLVDRDLEHLNLLKLGFYVMAGFLGFFSLFALLYIGIGGIIASGAIPPQPGSPDPKFLGVIFVAIGIVVLVIGLGSSFLTYFAGRSLRDRRRRTFCFVVAGLCCLQIPWGTALGVCAILVLSRPSVKALFEASGPPPPIPPGYGAT